MVREKLFFLMMLFPRPQLKDYAETLYANGTKTSAFDLDFTNGNVQIIYGRKWYF